MSASSENSKGIGVGNSSVWTGAGGAGSATGSTGAVHSHARRALVAGADRKEVEHTLLVLVSTIGFPKVAAALAWVQEDFD